MEDDQALYHAPRHLVVLIHGIGIHGAEKMVPRVGEMQAPP